MPKLYFSDPQETDNKTLNERQLFCMGFVKNVEKNTYFVEFEADKIELDPEEFKEYLANFLTHMQNKLK